MVSGRDDLNVATGLYDAALGYGDWGDGLRQLNETLGGRGYNLFLFDHRAMTVPFSISVEIPPDLLEEYSAGYAQIDPGLQYFTRNPNRSFYYNALHSDAVEMRRHPYYAWLERMGGVPYYLAYTFDLDAERSAVATLQLSHAHGHAERADFEAMERFRPHIRNCVRIQSLFQNLDLHRESAYAAIDALPTAVLLQDRTGRVSFCNSAAEAMFNVGDGLDMREGRPCFTCAEAARAYRRALAGDGGDPPVRARRPSGRADYLLQVIPLKCSESWIGAAETEVITILSDPARGVRLTGMELQALFGLTAAEARVALLLARGHTPADVTTRLAITRNTLNSHRKRIFEKLGIASQAELARYLIAI